MPLLYSFVASDVRSGLMISIWSVLQRRSNQTTRLTASDYNKSAFFSLQYFKTMLQFISVIFLICILCDTIIITLRIHRRLSTTSKNMHILEVYSIHCTLRSNTNVKKIPMKKINVTKNALLFLSRAPTHHSFTLNLRFLYELEAQGSFL